jgi:hypothetical protein
VTLVRVDDFAQLGEDHVDLQRLAQTDGISDSGSGGSLGQWPRAFPVIFGRQVTITAEFYEWLGAVKWRVQRHFQLPVEGEAGGSGCRALRDVTIAAPTRPAPKAWAEGHDRNRTCPGIDCGKERKGAPGLPHYATMARLDPLTPDENS